MVAPYYKDEFITLYNGDCRDVLPTLAPDSMDSCVCDPPYDLTTIGRSLQLSKNGDGTDRTSQTNYIKRGFMGKAWDGTGIAFDPMMWQEVYRLLKPGAHLLAFGGTRTSHRMVSAIEDAGFEIRDSISWIYGSGFPKSKNIGNGKGTALKPAHEPICVARKPLAEKTVAANVIEYGTGALNIDISRIAGAAEKPGGLIRARRSFDGSESNSVIEYAEAPEPHALGRWPANLILDEYAAELLDEQSGELTSNSGTPFRKSGVQQACFGKYGGIDSAGFYGDTGGASRFFYVAKPSPAERNEGLEDRTAANVNDGRQTSIDNPFQRGDTPRRNTHPTVKPITLMRYLVRLITPEGGTVIDPFMGAGTTGIACELEGRGFIGIELDAEYCEIAHKRIMARTTSLFTEATA